MEQVPHLAVYCQDNLELYDKAISSYLLPMVVRYLNDQNNQVQKIALLTSLFFYILDCEFYFLMV